MVGCILGLFLAIPHLQAAPEAIALYPDGPPDSNGLSGPEAGRGCIGNISEPTITPFRPEKPNGASVVIFPGGGYKVVCVQSEGVNMAAFLNQRGLTAFVVKYRLPNGHHTIPANDARRAIRWVRLHASEYGIDPKKVGVMGFSAGGHLSTTVSTRFDTGNPEAEHPLDRQSSRPDFAIHMYPVVSMADGVTHGGSRKNLTGDNEELYEQYSNERHVTAQTPPTFILHCSDDKTVPVQNSLGYYEACVKSKVPVAMQIFEKGGHGPNAYNTNPEWAAALDHWLTARHVLENK
jgi:acetyl esterase/lipase